MNEMRILLFSFFPTVCCLHCTTHRRLLLKWLIHTHSSAHQHYTALHTWKRNYAKSQQTHERIESYRIGSVHVFYVFRLLMARQRLQTKKTKPYKIQVFFYSKHYCLHNNGYMNEFRMDGWMVLNLKHRSSPCMYKKNTFTLK